MKILKRIWPWSKIAKLESLLKAANSALSSDARFEKACLAYMDQIEPNLHHVRMGNHLWLVGIDSSSVYIDHSVAVREPRMQFKVEGLET